LARLWLARRRHPGQRGWALDAALGLAIAAPVYWPFTQVLAIN
jgi:hypothetical protein